MKKTKDGFTSLRNRPNYIREYENAAESTQVAARIPLSVKQEFENAQEVLRSCGLDMQLNDVIRDSLVNATKFVLHEFGSNVISPASNSATTSLAIRTKEKVAKALPHSSTESVEESTNSSVKEWGASGSVEGTSTDTEASPLMGSTVPSEAPAGVVASSRGGKNGAR